MNSIWLVLKEQRVYTKRLIENVSYFSIYRCSRKENYSAIILFHIFTMLRILMNLVHWPLISGDCNACCSEEGAVDWVPSSLYNDTVTGNNSPIKHQFTNHLTALR